MTGRTIGDFHFKNHGFVSRDSGHSRELCLCVSFSRAMLKMQLFTQIPTVARLAAQTDIQMESAAAGVVAGAQSTAGDIILIHVDIFKEVRNRQVLPDQCLPVSTDKKKKNKKKEKRKKRFG